MLGQEELERIDRTARSLLEDPGVQVEDEEVADRLISAGARHGSRSQVVRFPEKVLAELLSTAPAGFFLTDRRGGQFQVGPGTPPIFWTGAALFYLDSEGWRPIYQRDLADFTRIIDNLDQVDGIVGTSTEDTPPPCRDFVGLRIMAENTDKHLRALSFSPKGGKAMVEMARVLAGGKTLKEHPLFSIGFTAHGPLRWTGLALGLFKTTAGHGIPCTVNGEPMAGASSPVTLAGTAAVGTAEILSGIAINQVLEPGRPCFFNLGFAHVMDMRTGFAVTGGPENALLAVAGAELARYYHLPSVSWMCSDSLSCDSQNALEKMLAAVTHAQAGVNLIWGVGQLESEKTISPLQAVIDNEILSLTRKYLEAFKVDEECLALEEIRKVGITGNFLNSDHTLDHFRNAFFEPRFLVRKPRVPSGSEPTLLGNAEAFVEHVLSSQRRPILKEEEKMELDRIEKRFRNLS